MLLRVHRKDARSAKERSHLNRNGATTQRQCDVQRKDAKGSRERSDLNRNGAATQRTRYVLLKEAGRSYCD